MMKVKIMLDEGAYMPTRAHKTDAGMDLYARETKVVPARGSEEFDTGVHSSFLVRCFTGQQDFSNQKAV